jgi:hypothetical protein
MDSSRPTRRHVLRVGGATILGAAVLAACGDGKKGTAVPGPSAGGSGASSSASSVGGNTDLALIRTAASIEALAIAAYRSVAASPMATLFADHHLQHLDAVNSLITGAGSNPVTEPNAAIKKAVLDPVIGDPALDEAKLLKLVYDLESAAAQVYAFASTQLSTAQLRSTMMTIGGVEERHAVVLGFVSVKLTPTALFPAAFASTEDSLAAIPGAHLS